MYIYLCIYEYIIHTHIRASAHLLNMCIHLCVCDVYMFVTVCVFVSVCVCV